MTNGERYKEPSTISKWMHPSEKRGEENNIKTITYITDTILNALGMSHK